VAPPSAQLRLTLIRRASRITRQNHLAAESSAMRQRSRPVRERLTEEAARGQIDVRWSTSPRRSGRTRSPSTCGLDVSTASSSRCRHFRLLQEPTLRMIGGVEEQTSGLISSTAKTHVAPPYGAREYRLSNSRFPATSTVRDVAFGRAAKKVSGDEITAALPAALASWSEGFEKRKPGKESRRQAQRSGPRGGVD